jgi:hypothetical protein
LDTYPLVKRFEGNGFITLKYKSSVSAAIMTLFPEHPWQLWRFTALPLGFWSNVTHQRQYFDEFMKRNGITQLEDMYNVTTSEIAQQGGSGLLRGVHNNSLWAALKAAYPEHEWRPWRFRTAPMGFWQQRENQQWFMECLCADLGITTTEQRERITREDIQRYGGAGLLAEYQGSAKDVLRALFPDVDTSA